MIAIHEFHPARFFLQTWRDIDNDALQARAAREAAGPGYDYRPLIALTSGAVLLSLMWYYGNSRTFFQLVDALHPELRNSPFLDLWRVVYWGMARVMGFFVLPVLVLWLTRQSVREQGLTLSGLRGHMGIYLVLLAVVMVPVVAVSYTSTFSTYYPIYKTAQRSWFDFGVWEIVYAMQFFALEFFFRGFWLKACRDAMGSHAIIVMVVPYCMLHFGKPVIETLAAIVAGVVLGTLAMKTRSIWGGVLIHIAVALSMDVLAIMHSAGLPRVFWPFP